MSPTGEGAPVRVAVLADDLIWSTRLAEGLRKAGAEPVPLRTIGSLATALPGVAGVVVDLTARAYDGLAAVVAGAAAGVPVVAVAQHDDAPLRAAARAAGAGRVYAYRALFERGERELAAWIATLPRPAAEEVR